MISTRSVQSKELDSKERVEGDERGKRVVYMDQEQRGQRVGLLRLGFGTRFSVGDPAASQISSLSKNPGTGTRPSVGHFYISNIIIQDDLQIG
jgi:hypothetical protein